MKPVQNNQDQKHSTDIKPATRTDINPFNIQFINEQPINYLSQDAPEMPLLLRKIEGQSTKNFLRKGIVAALVGAGGIGKTHCLTQLALSITTGTPFLKIYSVVEAGHVFMGLGENDPDDIHRLLRKHTKNKSDYEIDLASKRLSVMSFMGQQSAFAAKEGVPTKTYSNFLKALIDKEPEEGWTLIILDPISRFFGPDTETDNSAATQFIALLENIILKLKSKPTIIFGHHMNKQNLGNTITDQNASRGASGITDGARWQANLEKVESDNDNERFDRNKIGFRVVKSNFGAIPEPHILEKDEEGRLIHSKDQPQQKKFAPKQQKQSKPKPTEDEEMCRIVKEVALDQQSI